MDSYIISKEKDGVLLFTINRPARRNAIDYEVMAGLETAIEMAADRDVKVFAITGAGEQAFCSGGDLSAFHQLKTEEQAYGMLSRMAGILYNLLTLPKPTIAILNGSAVGGGCEIASACDFRIGKAEMKAGFVQANLAITTGWGGGTILLERLPHAAMKMLLDARIHNAEELMGLGFLNHLYTDDPIDACLSFMKESLNKETAVLEAYKSLINKKWEQLSMRERMEAEAAKCAVLWGEEAHHQKVDDFMSKKNKNN
ncbi:enoyl-CoA hydratase/isomerase family protein [Bacillus sp. ISL-35]|uniref:enoyl-CoA hydratase/isomerase family protein n=1 Tax=Bacillus sp. ISL-35 TaxID=2819122 RepID=UPI001BE9741D|nr:enoyl-CoA hydratase/isomerase family protein [Bacillus sp. ISL-35]MBT2678460.1 enoyl-CoA hydratase/isomerase family protein [Bacillus sp. ISL-35]MBT2701709.1 enoyl-CoA hydratase/isomerase family protein [Chryseobacterium sp. ISL-80]